MSASKSERSLKDVGTLDKRVVRWKASSYMVENGLLFHRKPKTNEWKQVPRCGKERSRILEACHSLPEGMIFSSCLHIFL